MTTPDGDEMSVPKVLLSGNHQHIRLWREEQSLLRTWTRRPELLTNLALTAEQEKILASIKKQAK
jgi:tRNA (guanine37-N1)-methyltransferase